MENPPQKVSKVQTASYTLIICSIVVVILYLGQSLIIPFMFASILWLLMRKIRSLFYIIGLRDKWFPKWLKTILSSAVLFSSVWVIGLIFEKNIQELIRYYDVYNKNLTAILKDFDHFSPYKIEDLTKSFNSNDLIGKYITSALSSLQTIISNVVIVLIYMLFIIMEESSFKFKIKAIFPEKAAYDERIEVIRQIEKAITNYLGIKSLIAMASAIICYLVFALMGLNAPFFWALLIFMFSFIPFFGVLISSFLPAIFSIIQFGTYSESLIILLSIGSIQFFAGNIVEPRIMGNTMNVSPIVVILSLGFWGFIWGFPGMFLSVPITVIMVIIFSKFKATRGIAILLSEKGEIGH
ncbi:AI-2E family transporter [Fluviicola sp.]|jgi:predicted PurR-regulated permease PerM|uniref:AI-2E family transporter n=1 Tax=Fluviicola sp. TaxID=1917219 RepID=UPI00282AC527|nr:AI-2E family transporter [Fluviicola sp.]MDR0801036.1 AI-2E family transporter [Fluviicola sp.]